MPAGINTASSLSPGTEKTLASSDLRLSTLVIAESFPNLFQTYVLNTLEETLKRGGQVTIAASGRLTKNYPERVDRLGLLGRTQYFPLDSLSGLLRGLRAYAVPFAPAGREAYRGLWILATTRCWRPSGLRATLKAIVKAPILARPRFDLVHAHNLHGACEYLLVSRIFDIPLVTTFYGLPTVGGSGSLSEKKLSELFRHGNVFLASTRYAQRQLEGLGCPAEKIVLLPQGLRLEDYPFRPRAFPKSGPIILLTVARLSIEKGHRYALEAVKKLRSSGRAVEYRIVGKGYERANLEDLIRELHLEKSARLLGELSEAEIQREYGEAHIFVLPSIEDRQGYHTETQGVVIQEAQASGAIVVASRTGGIPECVDDGRSAFLVPERDSEALADKLGWVLDHPDQWEAWQRAARVWVEAHFAMDKIGQRLWEIYTKAVRAHRNPDATAKESGTPHSSRAESDAKQ